MIFVLLEFYLFVKIMIFKDFPSKNVIITELHVVALFSLEHSSEGDLQCNSAFLILCIAFLYFCWKTGSYSEHCDILRWLKVKYLAVNQYELLFHAFAV